MPGRTISQLLGITGLCLTLATARQSQDDEDRLVIDLLDEEA